MQLKTVYATLVFLVSSLYANAQYARTSWMGVFKVPDDTNCLLEFRTDSLTLYFEDGSAIETMKYSVKGDTLVLKKLYGSSSCDATAEATYKMEMKNDKLFITPLKDDCLERAQAWPVEGLVKQN